MRKLKQKHLNANHTLHLLDPPDALSLEEHYRCVSCNKLLGINNLVIPSFNVKCSRCGQLNSILLDLSSQIFITDKDGTILFINEQVEKVTGYSSKEILGNKPSLWGNQMSKDFYDKMWDDIFRQKKAISVTITNRDKKGELYNASVRISPVLDSVGDVRYFIGMESVIANDSKKRINKKVKKRAK